MTKQIELTALIVRPIQSHEEAQWNTLMRTHHYLGFRQLVGESIKYVAEIQGRWVALLGWGTAAFKCSCRDQWIGWSKEQQWSRLLFIANNLRFLILPGVHIPNLASKVLSLNVKRLSADWVAVHGHPLILVETFVDHARFAGTCYIAAGWLRLGQTRGYGRNAGQYYYHGTTKTVLVYPLHRHARTWLSAPFLVPELRGGGVPVVNLNGVNLDQNDGLLERLKQLKDPRKPRGVRHSVTSTLAVAICATLSGARSFLAIGEWAADLSQDLLRRLGCRYHPEQRRYIPPSEPTLRRHLQSADAEQLDRILNEWLTAQTDPEAIAVDGKTVRGAKDGEGKALHLLSALLHKEGVVVAQRAVDKKTNEIREFQSVLDPLDLRGKVVTADALHTQVEHARYLVEDKQADYFFTVKGNQSNLKIAIEDLDDEDFSP
ncbi:MULTISPECIES: ISAs1 family transposase [Cohnella]|uniref:ISAs1 family transposase n=2 Tax=Paenibacillaceae TaxID=186822 RepID=UPI0004133D0E|nr:MULTISPECIES: ISAs1 family transposase [Cohnella]